MPPKHTVLAFGTSAAHCAVALLCGDAVLAQDCESMSRGQAESLFGIIERVMEQAHVGWRDIDAIGTGTGPGNFTGVRLSVSAARGLSLALDCPAIGVSTLQAQAYELGENTLSTVDARQNHVYQQVFGRQTTSAPLRLGIADITVATHGDIITCVGHGAENLAQTLGATHRSPKHPLAEAIARLAHGRVGSDHGRPAPLYLHEPDAVPGNRVPLRILP